MSNYTEYDATKFAADEMANHVAWVASLKPGDEVEARRVPGDRGGDDSLDRHRMIVGSVGDRDDMFVGGDTHGRGMWFYSPENIRPVHALHVDTTSCDVKISGADIVPPLLGKVTTQLYDWHPIPAREAGTDHPKHEHVYGGDGYAAARMLGKTVALYVDGRVAVDGEMFASTNYIAAKDAEAIAKRDAIIAELTERVRVLTPVERKPERGAGLLTMRPMTRVGG